MREIRTNLCFWERRWWAIAKPMPVGGGGHISSCNGELGKRRKRVGELGTIDIALHVRGGYCALHNLSFFLSFRETYKHQDRFISLGNLTL